MSADIAWNLWSLVCSCLNSYSTFFIFSHFWIFFKYVPFCTRFNLLTLIFMLPYIIMDLPIFAIYLLSLVFICTFLLFVARFPKRALRCSNGNIYKKPKRAIKSKTEQPKAFACFGFWDRTDSISKTRTSNEEEQKAMDGKWKHSPKTKTSNKEHFSFPFSLIFIHLLQLWTYGRWLTSRARKSQEEQQRAMKSNGKQQKAAESNKKQKRTAELEEPKRAIKTQNE